jgi:arsenate reductase (thioredoxin)
MQNQNQMTWLLVLVIGLAGIASSQMNGSRMVEPKRKSQIIFVCEHGAALSVVSAAYFNKIAREKHLNMHAIARGTEPQKDLAVSALQGLDSDGVSFETKRPQKLSVKDTRNARRVVAFCLLPRKYHAAAPIESWTDVPPTGANYARARDAILIHLRELIHQLEADETKKGGSELGLHPSRKTDSR